jgi:hypothetical protein
MFLADDVGQRRRWARYMVTQSYDDARMNDVSQSTQTRPGCCVACDMLLRSVPAGLREKVGFRTAVARSGQRPRFSKAVDAGSKSDGICTSIREPMDMSCLPREEAHSSWGVLHVEISEDETRLVSAATLEIASINSGD